MKTYQPKLPTTKAYTVKKACLLVALFFCLLNLNAQQKGNTKLAIETGPLLSGGNDDNLSFFYVEPKVKVVEKFFVGLRFGVAINAARFSNVNAFDFGIDEQSDNGVVSFVPTFDYYPGDFTLKNKIYRPYLGLGVGYYLQSDVDVLRFDGPNPIERLEVSVEKRVGLLLRGGFERRRLRIGLEYSFIPETDFVIPDGENVGTVGNSFLGLSVGLVIGGGKWLE